MPVLVVCRLTNRYVPPNQVASHSAWARGTLKTKATAATDVNEIGYYSLNGHSLNGLNPNLDEADRLVSVIVGPSVLGGLDAPEVRVIGRLPKKPPHRAYQSEDAVTVDCDDSAAVIVHEVGHYLESRMDALWWDVAALREWRDRGSRWFGSRAAGGIPVNEEPNENDQGRYEGDYPVTGPYTSKVYEEIGATEMVSMTLERLSTAESAKNLVSKDPVLLMTVLRHLRPDDQQLQAVCEQWAAYLPRS